ncbi:MAG: multiheme c-type cytochrome [Thermodesulfobacteriota bacterium]|nr:multiheme c-type cytochrome [Thermodesulfobacteriota bacterium]
MKRFFILFFASLVTLLFMAGIASAKEGKVCIGCHKAVTPLLVKDWQSSKHSNNEVACDVCHGSEHKSKKTSRLARMPDESTCAECHEEQFNQFTKGKHNFGWTSLNALPVTHMEPDELMEGGKGCGGCHNMGVKSEAQKKELRDKGYTYRTNSCDECHTRHSFSKKEAQDPKACRTCHMGFDHPQWEMYESSKHGVRYQLKEMGKLPKDAAAPTCQFCHLPKGTHTNKVAWGFLAVRLPLPNDKQWAKDRTTIFKALGVLDPDGKPTARLDIVKAADLARLTEEDWQSERKKMIKTCKKCHSEKYARGELEKGDQMIKKADRLLAEAINIVADLYKNGILKKPAHYTYDYPDFLHFYQTGGSYIEQVLFKMYMKHRMRTYQGVFHANPDYAYWYGWAPMTKDLDEVKKIAEDLRFKANAQQVRK